MNNQWGRSSGGATGGGSGIGGILFASIICLALGGAAGYGAFRAISGSASDSTLEERDRRIADLAGELDARVAQIEEDSRKAQALADEKAALQRQLDAMRTNSGKSDAAAIAENARLSQEVVPGLRRELERAEQKLVEAERLRTKAEAAATDRARQLETRAGQIAQLEKVLAEARSEQTTSQNAVSERLEAEAETLRRELAEAEQVAKKLRTRELPDLVAEIASKNQEIATLTARNAALEERITALETATQPKSPQQSDENGARDNAKPADDRSPRNAALVAQVIERTPGLDRLTGAQRTQLEQTLVSGECVTNALGSVLNRVPILALRGLMRDLDSDC
jgi:chromosome segregation ATPase